MAASTTWARRSAPFGIAARRQPRRRFDQAREHRRLGDLHLAGGFAEIALRRGFDAIGAGAEIDAVEIELEDFWLLLNLRSSQTRQHHLLHLAQERALLGQEQVLGELLGDGRAALRDAAVQDVGHRGAREPDRIDAVVAVEAAVLDRDERLRQIGRQLLERHVGAAHFAARRQRSCRRSRRSRSSAAAWEFRSDWIGGRVAATQTNAADGGDHAPQRRARATQ